MNVNRILETCLYVDDLDAARRFYQEVLGLQSFASVAGRHVFFRCGAGVLLLFNPDETATGAGSAPAHGAHGPGHIAFAMAADQVDAWRERLAQNGVPVEAEVTWPGGFSLYFRDPAGNSLELTTPGTWGLE